jgi:hypothetical protein
MGLARFVLNLVLDEESKVERFENGLNPRIKERVMCHEVKDYARRVEIASLAKRGIQESAVAYDLKRQSRTQTTYPVKRKAVGSGSRPSMDRNPPPTVGNQKPFYNKCGRPHMGECWKCFECWKTRHYSRNCPMKEAQQQHPEQARVYSLTPGGNEDEYEGEMEYSDVVIGTIPLFDLGAMHSFISSTYVKLCSMITQPMDQYINVSTPAGDVVTCRKIVVDCPIVFDDRVLPANLVVFHMIGFDIIRDGLVVKILCSN